MRWSSWKALALPLVASSPLFGQSLPPLMPRGDEIALARSAGPPEISKAATVLVLQRGGYVVAEKGTSGVTCYVNRDRVESLEPHCFDEEGSGTIVPIQLRRAELREQGADKAAIDRDIAEGLHTGRFRLPRRPAVSYMLSAGQVLYSPTSGNRVGKWHPHIMIYYPYLKGWDIGLPEGSDPPLGPTVADPGEATSSIVVIMPEFINPVAVGATAPRQ